MRKSRSYIMESCRGMDYPDRCADGLLRLRRPEGRSSVSRWSAGTRRTTGHRRATRRALPIAGGVSYAYGYDVMIAKLLAEELGYELEIVKLDWDSLIPAVQSGDVDAVIAGPIH